VNTAMNRDDGGTKRRNLPGALQILAIILVAQLVLVAILYWPRPAPAGAGEALLLGVKSDEVTSLTVTDNQGNRVKLAKTGAQWVLPEAGDYPADATKITPVLDQLVEMKANRLVAETPASQARLQVADDAFARRIDIETPAGMKTVYVGTSGGAGSSHVRLGGQNQVYLVSGVSDWQIGADPLSWTNSAYFTVPQSDVVAMTLTNPNGQFAFAKGAGGQWTLQGLGAGETAAQENIQRLLSAASSVTLVRPLGKTEDPAFGLGQPSAVVTLVARTDNQDKAYTLTVGSQDPNDQTYVVKSSESPYFVRAAGAVVGDLVSDTRESFLSLPATAVPAAAAATPAAAP
jgi:hypothetical protein